MTAALSSRPLNTPLGSPIPALLPHAISVSLPTWQDNIGYEEGHKRVVGVMQTGYPRFFIHRSIQKLAEICVAKFGDPATEACLLVPSPRVAQECRAFVLRLAQAQAAAEAQKGAAPAPAPACRIVEFVICPSVSSLVTPIPTAPAAAPTDAPTIGQGQTPNIAGLDCVELQIVLFPKALFPLAKQFWQHTGDGVSSRLAERALAFMGEGPAAPLTADAEDKTADDKKPKPPQTAVEAEHEQAALNSGAMTAKSKMMYSRNRHYSRKAVPSIASLAGVGQAASTSTAGSASASASATTATSVPAAATAPADDADEPESLSIDHATYLEERYGRNLPLASAALAKSALRRRIAGELLPHEREAGAAPGGGAGAGELHRGAAREAAKRVTEGDVYLYPTGMSAIWHAHDLVRNLRRKRGEDEGKSVCFGFPYTDTLKILQKWGPGCHFFGHGTASDIDELAALLASIRASGSESPIQALFCEFPSNPLLRSPDLRRLRALADEYGFLIVVDETIGNFVNVEVASWTDIVVSSLTKVFSGETNVMGGALVVSPNSRYYSDLHAVLGEQYEDNYFAEDAIYLERNSRDFRPRVATINNNAFALTEYLRSRSLANPSAPTGSVIKEVYYPRYSTPENYLPMQRTPTTGKGGFGGLFSLFFTSERASEAFFDNLHCAKGPSLGTVFTLACPYAILAHYYELEWALSYGVEAGLVRVSVGQEEYGYLEGLFKDAVDAAEAADAAGK